MLLFGFGGILLFAMGFLLRPLLRAGFKLFVAFAGALVPVAAVVLYMALGAPDVPGQPFAERMKIPGAWSAAGESAVEAHGGAVVPEALKSFYKAYAADSSDARAQFYIALAFAQVGDFKRAVSIWRNLERQGPADAPWMDMVRAHIKDYALKGRFKPSSVEPAPPPLSKEEAARKG